MKKQERTIISLGFAALTILIILSACQMFVQGIEEKHVIQEKYYTFNPETILTSLSVGKTNLFASRTSTPEPTLLAPIKPVQWQQVDYFHIAQAIYEYVWQDSVEEWNLSGMDYDVDCLEANLGAQYAHFEFFKVNNNSENQSRLVRDILIEPEKSSIKVWETEYVPKILDWSIINRSNLKVSVDVALKIAEDNGGKEARLAIQNECHVYLILVPSAMYSGWQVGYSGKDPVDQILFHIDPETGKFDIVVPKNK